MVRVTAWEEEQPIRNERARTSLRKAWLFFQKNQLYIDVATCRKIEDLFQQGDNALVSWYKVGNPPGEESAKNFDAAIAIAQRKIPEIRSSIEAEFRKALGTETEGQ